MTDDTFGFTRNQTAIVSETALDGIYVVRTNLSAAQSDAAATVRAYKSLSGVERAFRSMKTVDLELRPVFHWTAPRVRAHVLLCMLASHGVSGVKSASSCHVHNSSSWIGGPRSVVRARCKGAGESA